MGAQNEMYTNGLFPLLSSSTFLSFPSEMPSLLQNSVTEFTLLSLIASVPTNSFRKGLEAKDQRATSTSKEKSAF